MTPKKTGLRQNESFDSAPYLITANAAKNRYAKLKCSHKFTHALEPVHKRLVMFHDLHIIVRLKAAPSWSVYQALQQRAESIVLC